MKDFARDFYTSKAWLRVSRAYMTSKNYICERCGKPAKICHHKVWLNASNINDPTISLNMDLLECLCQDCHTALHCRKHTTAKFSEDGSIHEARQSAEEKSFLNDRKKIDELLNKLTSQKA